MDTNTVSAPEVHASIDHPYSDFMSNIGYPKEDDSRSHENLPDGIYLEDVVDDDNSNGIYRQVYTRSIVENGQKVEKPANRKCFLGSIHVLFFLFISRWIIRDLFRYLTTPGVEMKEMMGEGKSRAGEEWRYIFYLKFRFKFSTIFPRQG